MFTPAVGALQEHIDQAPAAAHRINVDGLGALT
jgi:hypothetical protein